MALAASTLSNAYLSSQISVLSSKLDAANSQNQALVHIIGTFVRNGTTFDEVALNRDTLANGTTIIFKNVAFTYIERNYNMTAPATTFKIGTGEWTEILIVILTNTNRFGNAEVYTQHTNPTAGLGMNVGNPRLVFIFVSIQPVQP